MGKCFFWCTLLLCCGLLGLEAQASGEEQKEAAPQAPREEVAAPEAPLAPEAPDLSLDEAPLEEPEMPSLDGTSAPTPVAKKKPKKTSKRTCENPYDLDCNMDYSEVMGRLDPGPLGRGVLAPALGTRGYRPSMVGISAGERTPGFGAFFEYSWNRVAFGSFASWRSPGSADRFAETQTFYGFYTGYRWLPYDTSPYFHLGLEGASATPSTFGGFALAGIESRVWYGWTLLLGYGYHSTVRKGFFGGAVAWTF